MRTEYDRITEETCLETVRPSGLTVRIVKKPGKSRKTAMMAAKFGSINREFEYNGKTVTVPNGTAHFLEHKMFEGKNGNAFDFYAQTGAKANAYTSNDKTAYYFVCTDWFEKNLEILLSFMSNPYLTDENVEKEKGIIGQEIKMYEDEPSWQGYFELIGCLYGTHPVKYDIAGTVDDIAPITVDTLKSCYDTFYAPSNMVLSVVGDVDENSVTELCDKYFPPRKSREIRQNIPLEPRGIVRPYAEKNMAVSRPLFYIGIKDNEICGDADALARKETEIEMLTEILFGSSTPFYKRLYDDGVINSEFESSYEMSDTFAFMLIAGESDDPQAVLTAVKERIAEFLERGVSAERFVQVRNTLYGELISGCDNVSQIASMLMSTALSGRDPFDRARILSDITPADITARAEKILESPDIAMSVIKGE